MMDDEHRRESIELTVSNRTVVRVLLLVVVTMLGLAALRRAQHALVLVFVSFFLALAFNSPVAGLARRLPKKKRGSRSLATALSALFLIVVLGIFIASVLPPIVKQSTNFIQGSPQLVRDLQNEHTAIGSFVKRYNLEPQIEKASDELSTRLKNASGAAVSTISEVGSSVFSGVTVLVLTFMMLIEGPKWIRFINRFIPDEKRDDTDELARRMYKVVKGYINGQVALASMAALLILPMLFILHVPYPFALMFFVFICGLIPMIGHTIGAFVVTLVALTNSTPSALIILAYYVLYQQLENYVVQPKVQSNTTDMSPLLVFLAVVIGVSFSGILGGLLAIPIMGCIRVAIIYWIELRDAQTAEG